MQKHSRPTPAGASWYTERLWALARDLPVVTVPLADIAELDQNCWCTQPPTCREVAAHAKQILDADLDFPIILSCDGLLMDGGHRLAKAWLLGIPEVKVQRFPQDPEPDYVVPRSGRPEAPR